jgi:hypothetical protein
MRYILTLGVSALVLCPPASAWAANWKPVPNQRGVFVDMAHIQHIAAVADPTGPDTKVEITRYGQKSEVYVRCEKDRTETKDLPVVEIDPDLPGSKRTIAVISMKELRAAVCA